MGFQLSSLGRGKVIWSVDGNYQKTGNSNNPIICSGGYMRENAQSPSIKFNYNEQRAEDLSRRLRPREGRGGEQGQ